MKLVTVIIKPFKLDDVREALSNAGVVDFLPKIRIDIAVGDEILDSVIEAILKSARTGKVGDGKIFVTELEHVVRIRTGETDEAAI